MGRVFAVAHFLWKKISFFMIRFSFRFGGPARTGWPLALVVINA